MPRAATPAQAAVPALNKLLTEAENNFCAYALGGGHRHTPEIEQNIAYITGKDLMKPETWQYINFQPHLLPQVRGIEVTIYATCDRDFTNEEVYELYKDFYKDEPFVKVFPASLPVQTKWVYGTNFCEMTPTFDARTHRLIVSSVIDNIGKGAADPGHPEHEPHHGPARDHRPHDAPDVSVIFGSTSFDPI